MKNISVGQKVYLVPSVLGNAIRRNENIIETKIEKVGRKYATIEKGGQFEISSGKGKTIYTSDYTMYLSKVEAVNVVQSRYLEGAIKSKINTYRQLDISLDKMKKIAFLMDIKEKEILITKR